MSTLQNLLMICSFFFFNQLIIAQNFNRPVPPSAFQYEFEQLDPTNYGYYLTVPFHFVNRAGNPEFKTPLPMILDENGYVLLYFSLTNDMNIEFKYFPEEQSYGYISLDNNVFTYKLFDFDFNLIDEFNNSAGIGSDLHEFQILDNGNYLIAGFKNDTVDLSGNVIDGVDASATTIIKGFVIEEFDADHNLIFQWNSNDYVNPLDAYEQYGYDPDNYDYAHGNAIEQDTDGNYLISLRHTNAVYKINRDTGAIIWTLGGKSSDFTFPDDNGFGGQHDVRRLPNGNITIFDNGNTLMPEVTRAIEYELDTTNWTANLIWEYTDATPFFARAMGSHQTKEDRNHLINYGLVNRPYPSVSLVDDNKNVISNIYFEDNVVSYRSYIFNAPITIERPEVNCSQFTNSIELSAPNGHANYVWSNGDETQTTTITEPGVYQVWVDQGSVMMGSEPIVIDNIATACETLDVEEYELESVEKKIIATYDVLGREIKETKANQLYIIRYDDNSTKKVIYGE